MNIFVNPSWREENLKCYLCGETKDVAYTTEVIEDAKKEVCICKKCALTIMMASGVL